MLKMRVMLWRYTFFKLQGKRSSEDVEEESDDVMWAVLQTTR